MNEHDVRRDRYEGYRREILRGIERELRIKCSVDRLSSDGTHQQRIAIGSRAGDQFCRDVSAGARTIVDETRTLRTNGDVLVACSRIFIDPLIFRVALATGADDLE